MQTDADGGSSQEGDEVVRSGLLRSDAAQLMDPSVPLLIRAGGLVHEWRVVLNVFCCARGPLLFSLHRSVYARWQVLMSDDDGEEESEYSGSDDEAMYDFI